MGLTKQYLRYQAAGNFNIISSGGCNVAFVTLEGQEGRFVGVAACEDIIVWDLRLGEKAMVIPGDKHLVTRLAASPTKRHLAAGYSDGSVKLFDLKTGDALTTFAGHRSAVTCLAYDAGGHRLASGAKDTDIILWDVIAETGTLRLSGHKGVVTEICFLEDGDYLASSSKDTFVKLWDLATSHCFKTLVGHQTEVWGLALMQGCHLVTGSGDSELRVWHVEKREPGAAAAGADREERIDASDAFVAGEEADVASPLRCRKVGAVLRAGRGRVVSLARDGQGRALTCHGADGCVELFSFAAEEEGRLRMRKRQRKERQKREKAGEESTTEGDAADAQAELTLKDIVRRLPVVKVADGKVKAVDLVMGKGDELRVAVSLSNNCVELHSLLAASGPAAGGACEASLLRRVASQGHRTEVRSVCFSSDGLAVVSAAADTVKMWNRPSLTCLRTVDSGYVLCSCFVPGDRHVLAGLKDGRLLIVDIASGDVLEEIPAHTKELWAVCLMPDSRGCVTGGGDHAVRFWQFELVADEDQSDGGSKAKVLSLLHKRTLKLEETVLAVKVSPNGNLVAVALLDSTVKIFFVDTLKFFVSLYGHKLPVLCLDISYDSTLIVTGSSDRNVKVWGLDFGDCHKSLFAHDDSVTAVQFVPRTHQFFSCGKDGRVKQWDADSFDKILTLQGHFGEAWSLAVSPNGQFVVSCGSDRVVRMYERTDEPLVLADEQEGEREEEGLATGEGTAVAGRGELGLPSKKTVGSERAAEQLLECLDICREVGENPDAPIHPVMQAFNVKTIDDFVLDTIRRIRPSDLEEALLLLPFPSACHLLRLLPPLLSPSPANAELVCRTAVFLVTIHHAPLVANAALLPTVREIHRLAAVAVHKLRDLVGYNLHGLQHLQHEMEERDKIQLFRDAAINRKNKRNRKVRKRTIVTL